MRGCRKPGPSAGAGMGGDRQVPREPFPAFRCRRVGCGRLALEGIEQRLLAQQDDQSSASGTAKVDAECVVVSRADRYTLLEVLVLARAEAQEPIASVAHDGERGRRDPVDVAQNVEQRVGPDPFAEKAGGQAGVAQGQSLAPIVLAHEKVGPERCETGVDHLAAQHEREQDAGDGCGRAEAQHDETVPRGPGPPRKQQADGEHYEGDDERGIGGSLERHQEGVGRQGEEPEADQHPQAARSRSRQRGQERHRHEQIAGEVPPADVHAGEPGRDTEAAVEIERIDEGRSLDQCRDASHRKP